MPLKAVFFDIDGTLVDSNEFHVMAWDEAFRDHGLQAEKAIIRGQIGKGADQLIPTLFPDMEEEVRHAIDKRHGEIFRTTLFAAGQAVSTRNRSGGNATRQGQVRRFGLFGRKSRSRVLCWPAEALRFAERHCEQG